MKRRLDKRSLCKKLALKFNLTEEQLYFKARKNLKLKIAIEEGIYSDAFQKLQKEKINKLNKVKLQNKYIKDINAVIKVIKSIDDKLIITRQINEGYIAELSVDGIFINAFSCTKEGAINRVKKF